MQTAKIIPITNKKPQLTTDSTRMGVAEAEWLWPGRLITIAPGIHITIAYDQTDGEYTTRFKFWHEGDRLKDYTLDENQQIDLTHTCNRIITAMATKYNPDNGRPNRTLIEVAYAPYPWQS